jgi:hypothetical protein
VSAGKIRSTPLLFPARGKRVYERKEMNEVLIKT